MKFTIDLPAETIEALRREGAFTLLSPPDELDRAAKFQAAQIIHAGLDAFRRFPGPERPRDIAFTLSQKFIPTAAWRDLMAARRGIRRPLLNAALQSRVDQPNDTMP